MMNYKCEDNPYNKFMFKLMKQLDQMSKQAIFLMKIYLYKVTGKFRKDLILISPPKWPMHLIKFWAER